MAFKNRTELFREQGYLIFDDFFPCGATDEMELAVKESIHRIHTADSTANIVLELNPRPTTPLLLSATAQGPAQSTNNSPSGVE